MTTKLAIMQPYLFPYIGYFQLINVVDKFVLFDDVNYINKGWINRNKILVNGKGYMFTIPLKNASQNKLIKDIEVSDSGMWRTKFLRTVEMNYSKSPHYKYIMPMVTELVLSEAKSISELIGRCLLSINDYLDINTSIVDTSAAYDNRHLKAEARIIDICLKEGSDRYINLVGGMDLYSKESFKKKGIELMFIESKPVTYRQYDNEFVPCLSIIDVLMFNSKEKTKEHLNNYILI